jgi:hypothetical protein
MEDQHKDSQDPKSNYAKEEEVGVPFCPPTGDAGGVGDAISRHSNVFYFSYYLVCCCRYLLKQMDLPPFAPTGSRFWHKYK